MADFSFIANQQQQSGLTPIANMLDFASKAQAMQRGALSLQKERELLQPEIERGKAESQRAQTESRVAAETADPLISTAKSTASTAETGSKKASFDLQKGYATAALEEAAGLFRNPAIEKSDPKGTIEALVQARKRMVGKGIPEHIAEGLTAELMSNAGKPGAVLQQLRDITQANAGAGTRAGVVNAPLSAVNNGQQMTFVQPQPGAPGAVQPGASMQMQLPPTTPTFNPQTNTPGYLGPQGNPRPVQSGPALGVPANVAGNVDVVNKDWGETVQKASGASQDIGVLQEIKKYAQGAVTGVLGDRRSFINGLAGLLHMDAGELARTDTDLLAKNTNMVALAGGDTNLARTMAEGANPNVHMTKEAIVKAANQIIAQKQLVLAKQQYLGKFKDDPTAYQQALTHFNAVADPRILQLQSMSPQEKAAMKAAMSPQEQKSFSEKIRSMYQMGILR